jgi:hypothetical protein
MPPLATQLFVVMTRSCCCDIFRDPETFFSDVHHTTMDRIRLMFAHKFAPSACMPVSGTRVASKSFS